LQSLSAVQNGGKKVGQNKKNKNRDIFKQKISSETHQFMQNSKKNFESETFFFYVGVEKERKLKCQEHFQSKKDLGEMLRENR
jgi:hypothetical protein